MTDLKRSQKLSGLLEIIERSSLISAKKLCDLFEPKTLGGIVSEHCWIESTVNIKNTLEKNYENLIKEATEEVTQYLTQFRVNSKEIDFYKLGYFICIAISKTHDFS